mgnify:CR=1 FL=1
MLAVKQRLTKVQQNAIGRVDVQEVVKRLAANVDQMKNKSQFGMTILN